MSRTRLSIPITRPVFGETELEGVRRTLESGWVVQGPFVAEFEARVASYTGAEHAVATSSGTTALHAAVAALELRPGDEVIVPAFTWVATANVVEQMGATPVFCDVDLETFNLDPTQLGSLVTSRTVGIIPVHLFGLCADVDAVLAVAQRHGLWVLEDAACALGSRYGDRHAGTFGQAAAFSFHPRKSITTGEGGMVTTSDRELADKVRSLRNHGAAISRADTSRPSYLIPDHDEPGFNYRLTDVQGAIGVAQMDRLEWILDERRRCAARYDEALASMPWLALPVVPEGSVHSYQSYVCLFRPEDPTLARARDLHERRNGLMARLDAEGIATRPGTHAVTLQSYYARKYRIAPEAFPGAFLADRLSLALPLYPSLDSSDIDLIAERMAAAFDA